MGGELVLVTGVSGSIAGATAKALQAAGFSVRGTVRDISDAASVGHLERLCPGLELVAADLMDDAGWDEACAGCKFVMHIASPFPLEVRDPEEVIRPAVDGTRRVLGAALRAGATRLVMTSSVAAVAFGFEGTTPKGDDGYLFTDADWSDAERCDAYAKSKTLAERAAWELVKGTPLELVTINPCFVQGPMTSARACSSATMIRRLLTGDMPALPNVGLALCDIRDVADCHVAALTAEGAAGKRYIVHSHSMFMPEIAALLHADYAHRGYPVPTRRAPRLLLRCLAVFDGVVRNLLPSVDYIRQYDHAPAERDLLRRPHRTWQEAVRATAESLIALGVVNVPGAT